MMPALWTVSRSCHAGLEGAAASPGPSARPRHPRRVGSWARPMRGRPPASSRHAFSGNGATMAWPRHRGAEFSALRPGIHREEGLAMKRSQSPTDPVCESRTRVDRRLVGEPMSTYRRTMVSYSPEERRVRLAAAVRACRESAVDEAAPRLSRLSARSVARDLAGDSAAPWRVCPRR
jgi:hypothetical protein